MLFLLLRPPKKEAANLRTEPTDRSVKHNTDNGNWQHSRCRQRTSNIQNTCTYIHASKGNNKATNSTQPRIMTIHRNNTNENLRTDPTNKTNRPEQHKKHGPKPQADPSTNNSQQQQPQAHPYKQQATNPSKQKLQTPSNNKTLNQ